MRGPLGGNRPVWLRTAKWPVGPPEWKERWPWSVIGSEPTRPEAVGRKWGACVVTSNHRARGWVSEVGVEGKTRISISPSLVISAFPHCGCVLEMPGLVCTFHNSIHFGLQFPQVCDGLEEPPEEQLNTHLSVPRASLPMDGPVRRR